MKTFLEIERNLFNTFYYQQCERERDHTEDLSHIRWMWRHAKLSIRKIKLQHAVDQERSQSKR
jgi:hypothetical protein